jgi:hypothetical protein
MASMLPITQYSLVYGFGAEKLKLSESSIRRVGAAVGNKFGKIEVTFLTDGAS